jgi:hypothetical protein
MDAPSLHFLRRLAKTLLRAAQARDVRILARARIAFSVLARASDDEVVAYLTLNRMQYLLAHEAEVENWAALTAAPRLPMPLVEVLERDLSRLSTGGAGFSDQDIDRAVREDDGATFLRAAGTVITDPAILRDQPRVVVDPIGDRQFLDQIYGHVRMSADDQALVAARLERNPFVLVMTRDASLWSGSDRDRIFLIDLTRDQAACLTDALAFVEARYDPAIIPLVVGDHTTTQDRALSASWGDALVAAFTRARLSVQMEGVPVPESRRGKPAPPELPALNRAWWIPGAPILAANGIFASDPRVGRHAPPSFIILQELLAAHAAGSVPVLITDRIDRWTTLAQPLEGVHVIAAGDALVTLSALAAATTSPRHFRVLLDLDHGNPRDRIAALPLDVLTAAGHEHTADAYVSPACVEAMPPVDIDPQTPHVLGIIGQPGAGKSYALGDLASTASVGQESSSAPSVSDAGHQHTTTRHQPLVFQVATQDPPPTPARYALLLDGPWAGDLEPLPAGARTLLRQRRDGLDRHPGERVVTYHEWCADSASPDVTFTSVLDGQPIDVILMTMGDGSVAEQGDLMPARFLPRAVFNLRDEAWRLTAQRWMDARRPTRACQTSVFHRYAAAPRLAHPDEMPTPFEITSGIVSNRVPDHSDVILFHEMTLHDALAFHAAVEANRNDLLPEERAVRIVLRQALTTVPLVASELAYVGSLNGHGPIQQLLYLRAATANLRRRGDWNPTAVDWSRRGTWWMDPNERGTRG